jgi:hypothetical protein
MWVPANTSISAAVTLLAAPNPVHTVGFSLSVPWQDAKARAMPMQAASGNMLFFIMKKFRVDFVVFVVLF